MAIQDGYLQTPSGYFKLSDGSGPYVISSAGVVTLMGGAVAAAAGLAGYPAGSTPVTSSSGNVANASAAATLAGAAGLTTYLAGFVITGGGATAASLVDVTVTGLLGGTATHTLGVVAGATLPNAALIARFVPPIPASGLNTAIVVTVPALGAGNTKSTVMAHGFRA